MSALKIVVPIVLALATIKILQKLRNKNRPSLPPGPPGEPILGNIRSLPTKDFDLYLHELGKNYGDVTYLNLLGQHMIVLNRALAGVALLDKRGSKHSGRPRFPLAEVQGSYDMIHFLTYGEEFRLHRRGIHQFLQKDNISQEHYVAIYTREARKLIQRLVAQPEEWSDHLITCTTSVVIELAYGHEIQNKDDPYLKIIGDFITYAATSVKPDGGAMVEFWPWLKYVPSWFPGGYWVGRAREARKHVTKFKEYPYEVMQAKIAEGTAKPCFLLSQLEALQNKTAHPALTPDHARAMACVLYIAGADTIASSLSSFFAAMILHPEYQDKAQEEIDRVLGNDRLPTLQDRSSLPYVDAIMKETLRWRPPVPLAVPHSSQEDDIYDGMFIPKGTTIIPNIRGMGLDDEIYKDPCTFDPERYSRGEPEFDAVWGFGRRVCPGKHLVEQSQWLLFATVLATLRIMRPLDAAGKETIPNIEWEMAVTCATRPFPCRIELRESQRSKAIMEQD